MKRYRVTLSDGRVVTVEAEQPPTEEDVLSAIGGSQQAPEAPAEEHGSMPVSPIPAALTAAGAAAPGIVSMANKATTIAGPVAKQALKGRIGWAGAAGAGMTMANQIRHGDMSGAAGTAATAAAASQVPKALGVIQKATTPHVGKLASGAKYTLKPGVTGAASRGASALSKLAGAVGVPASIISTILDFQNYALSGAADPETDQRERDAILGMLGGSPLSGILK